jgi:hypothetical protein
MLLATAGARADMADNDTCATAEAAGNAVAGTRLTGELEAPGGDVDYYVFTGRAGAFLEVRVRSQGGADLVAAMLDSNCENVLYYNDDFVLDQDFDPGFAVRVPAGGVMIIGVTGYPDAGLAGEHEETGSYEISFRRATGLVLSSVNICEGVPADGGYCRVNLRIDNRGGKRFVGKAWYIVAAEGIGGDVPFATIQIDPKRGALDLAPKAWTKLPASFRVAKNAPNAPASDGEPPGASYCVDVYVSAGSDPLFRTRARDFVGCAIKGEAGEQTAEPAVIGTRVPTRSHAIRNKARLGAN